MVISWRIKKKNELEKKNRSHLNLFEIWCAFEMWLFHLWSNIFRNKRYTRRQGVIGIICLPIFCIDSLWKVNESRSFWWFYYKGMKRSARMNRQKRNETMRIHWRAKEKVKYKTKAAHAKREREGRLSETFINLLRCCLWS